MRKDMAENMAKVVRYLFENGRCSGSEAARRTGLKKPTVAQWFGRAMRLANILKLHADIGKFDAWAQVHFSGVPSLECVLIRDDWTALVGHGLLQFQAPYFPDKPDIGAVALDAMKQAHANLAKVASQTPARDAAIARITEGLVSAAADTPVESRLFKVGQQYAGPHGHVWEVLPEVDGQSNTKLRVRLVSPSPKAGAAQYVTASPELLVDKLTGLWGSQDDPCGLVTLVKDIPEYVDMDTAKPVGGAGNLAYIYDDATVRLPNGSRYQFDATKDQGTDGGERLVGQCLILDYIRLHCQDGSDVMVGWDGLYKQLGVPEPEPAATPHLFFDISSAPRELSFNNKVKHVANEHGITYIPQENYDMTKAQDPFATGTPSAATAQDPNIIQAINKIMAEQKQLRAAYAVKDTELKAAQAAQLVTAQQLEPVKKEAEDYKKQAAEATQLAQDMQTRLQDALTQAAAGAAHVSAGTDDESALVQAFATTCQRAPNPLYIPGALDRFVEHCIVQGKPCLLTGPSGCGKTELFQYQLSRLRNSWVQVNFDGETTRSTMVVRRSAKDGKTMFELGALPLAMLAGIPIIFDEVDHADEQCQSALHEVTRTGKLFVTELNRTIIPKSGFFIGATCNSVGDATGLYSGRIGTAFKDRFAVRSMGYPSQAREVKIVMKATNCAPELAAKIASLWTDLRKMDGEALTGPFSTRQAVEIAAWIMYLTTKGYPIKKATAEAIACSLTDRVTPDERKTINEVAQRHLGVDSLAEQGQGE